MNLYAVIREYIQNIWKHGFIGIRMAHWYVCSVFGVFFLGFGSFLVFWISLILYLTRLEFNAVYVRKNLKFMRKLKNTQIM